MDRKVDLKGKLRKRVMQGMFGSITEDYVCCMCLAVVPEPSEGCQHCQQKQKKARKALNKFLNEKAKHD